MDAVSRREVKGRARERLIFSDPDPHLGRDVMDGGKSSEDKENFLIPKSPLPKQPKTPSSKTTVQKTSEGTAAPKAKQRSPPMGKKLQQVVALDDAGS